MSEQVVEGWFCVGPIEPRWVRIGDLVIRDCPVGELVHEQVRGVKERQSGKRDGERDQGEMVRTAGRTIVRRG